MILGIDASSSMIGWCLLNDDGTFVDIGHIELKKYDNEYEKIDAVLEFFGQNKHLIENSKVYIEEALMMFKAQSSMAQTLATLQRWNGMFCSALYTKFKVKPISLNVISARSKCKINVPKKKKGEKKIDTKEYVLEEVKKRKLIPENKWALKKTGKVKDWCYDQADAFVIATAGSILEREKK